MNIDKSEKRFERDIEAHLISHGYEQFNGQDAEGNWIHAREHDVSRCIYMDVLCEFIAATQPKEWAKYVKFYGDTAQSKLYRRLEDEITARGLIDVLRHGINDMGCKLMLCYFKPESTLNTDAVGRYNANILGCTRQFRYTTTNTNTIDMVLSVNGIPVVALELKNQLTGQSVDNAKNQYMHDRSSKEFAFRLNHRFLVYFAVDLYEAWMTTQLQDSSTFFMPFNQGNGGAGNVGGAGNPHNDNGYDTSYLWEEVLSRDSLMDILHRFVSFVRRKEETPVKGGGTKTVTKEMLMFPRYHQYDVVKKLMTDVRKHGSGTNYLIEHSAGSGKSNSIAWIAYRLAGLHDADNEPVFHSVVVVTNRVVLDNQLQDTINSFEHIPGLVEAIDEKKHSRDLAQAINDKKRIIICTIQKFLFAYKDIAAIKGRRFAVIIDEAHQGQSGESAKSLRRSLIDIGVAVKQYADDEGIDENEVDVMDEYVSDVLGQGKHENQSFFAFTATPKGKTLELFGTYDPMTDKYKPFHIYSMKQAIDEGFILDVLSNYTTIKEAFKLVRTTEQNPELVEGQAAKALFKFYKEHGYTIGQKTEMIMANFLQNGRYQIGGKGKAMVVADSRANAVRYFFAIKEYMAAHPDECAGCGVMVAFSGEVTLPERSDKPMTEASLNYDADGKEITTDKAFRKAFHEENNILVVANKYQTGFDEPLLHSMYVDKRLADVTAVQTLSRLNRTCRGKDSTFVLDFENTTDDIRSAFLPYYEITELEGSSDPNRVYDARHKVRDLMLYNDEDVDTFVKFMSSVGEKPETEAQLARFAGLFNAAVDRYCDMKPDDRYTARITIRNFVRAYAFVTQLVRLHDKELFAEYQYASTLVRLLPKEQYRIIDITEMIRLDYASLKETFRGQIMLDEKPPVFKPSDAKVKTRTVQKDTLQNIIEKVNERFGDTFSETDRVIVENIYAKFMHDPEVTKYKKYAKDNSTEMFVQSLFPDKFKDIVTQCFIENSDSFQKLFTDTDFYQKVMEAMAQELYKSLRRDK